MQKLLAQSTRRALPARASAVHALSPRPLAWHSSCTAKSLSKRPCGSSACWRGDPPLHL